MMIVKACSGFIKVEFLLNASESYLISTEALKNTIVKILDISTWGDRKGGACAETRFFLNKVEKL